MNERLRQLQEAIGHTERGESGEIDPHFGAALSDAQIHFLENPQETEDPIRVLQKFLRTERNSRLRPAPLLSKEN